MRNILCKFNKYVFLDKVNKNILTSMTKNKLFLAKKYFFKEKKPSKSSFLKEISNTFSL